MLRDQKLDYQRELEDYLEEHHVYEVFEDMMKSLVMHRPKDPISFLLGKLQSPEFKRLIIIGPPGSKRKELALSLAEFLSEVGNYTCISVGDLLNKEISKKSELGKQILQARKTYSYISDDIVINLVKKQVQLLEKDQKSWIIEGFPRTRLQALALQEMGIIPDKFILLNVNDETTLEKVKRNLKNEENQIKYKDEEIDQLAQNAFLEYDLHIEGVKETCRGFIHELDCNKSESAVLEDIARVIRLQKTRAPRRPPRIFLFGAPGSGKNT